MRKKIDKSKNQIILLYNNDNVLLYNNIICKNNNQHHNTHTVHTHPRPHSNTNTNQPHQPQQQEQTKQRQTKFKRKPHIHSSRRQPNHGLLSLGQASPKQVHGIIIAKSSAAHHLSPGINANQINHISYVEMGWQLDKRKWEGRDAVVPGEF